MPEPGHEAAHVGSGVLTGAAGPGPELLSLRLQRLERSQGHTVQRLGSVHSGIQRLGRLQGHTVERSGRSQGHAEVREVKGAYSREVREGTGAYRG